MSRTIVVHPDNMDQDTFQKHMNARHGDSLGGLSELKLTSVQVLLCYRAFHNKLHEFRPDLAHEHGDFAKS